MKGTKRLYDAGQSIWLDNMHPSSRRDHAR
jgi:hypothetical protein